MPAPTIPASDTQAVNTVGSTQNFTVQWWNFFNSLLSYITTGPLGPIPLIGVTDGSDAAAGNIGEYKSSFVLSGAAINLPSITDTQITSLTLPAGDWDLWGEIYFTPTTATMTACVGAINSTVSSTPTVPADGVDLERLTGISTSNITSVNGLRTRVSIVAPATYLLIAFTVFTGTSVAGYGALRARRVR